MTPTNRLEIFLAMIAGDETVTPIKPITNVEKYLNLIAMKRKKTGGKGNPWKDATGGIEAKLVTAQFAADRIFPMYMLDLDLGIDELPYNKNRMLFTVEGDHFLTESVESAAVNTEPMPQIAENTYGVTGNRVLLPEDSKKSTELSNMPGIFVVGINACFYQLAGETIHAQMLFALMEGDGDFNGDPNLLYANADSIRINVSFYKCVEIAAPAQ